MRLAVPAGRGKRRVQRGGRALEAREDGAGAVVVVGTAAVGVAVAAVAALGVEVLRDGLADLDARLAEVARVEDARDPPHRRRRLHLLLLVPAARREVVAVRRRRVVRHEALLHVEVLLARVLQGEVAVRADLPRRHLDAVLRLDRRHAEHHGRDDVAEAKGDAEDARREDGAPPLEPDRLNLVPGLPVVAEGLEAAEDHAPAEPHERVLLSEHRPGVLVPPLQRLPRDRQFRDEEKGGEEEHEDVRDHVEKEEVAFDAREDRHGHAGQHHGGQADQIEGPDDIEHDVAGAQQLRVLPETEHFVFSWLVWYPVSRSVFGRRGVRDSRVRKRGWR